eukprot:TRINITY_DN1058_c0_g1_i4.p1 TRINITY_DN1058_c0_g1~~TRINITY_DN1058_c0_g1_i4.p1  ORF type:complete len:522 (+),score=57.98 TRINITY_DN1058_c0_g1_i4:348-1913(+)
MIWKQHTHTCSQLMLTCTKSIFEQPKIPYSPTELRPQPTAISYSGGQNYERKPQPLLKETIFTQSFRVLYLTLIGTRLGTVTQKVLSHLVSLKSLPEFQRKRTGVTSCCLTLGTQKNSPQGPPNPNLITNTDTQYRVNLARMGPYNRNRIKRMIEHETKTRGMSEFEYLTYFKENEVHYAANEFELPEYEWAEARMERSLRKCKNENETIFEPARSEWIDKFKTQAKAVNYAPAMEYWLLTFKQWIPNFDKNVVESTVDGSIDAKWNSFISETGNYAAYRHPAYEAAFKSSQLGTTFGDYVASVDSDAAATRPYDCPNFRNKWYSDNGRELINIIKDDIDEGLGCRNRDLPVLQAEIQSLKDEIGCVELTEQRFKGEWWNRGMIKLMSTLEVMHKMELISAILSEAGCSATDSAEVVNQKLSAKDWSSFQLGSFSRLRYEDGYSAGIHGWKIEIPEGEERTKEELLQDKWKNAFLEIFNYEQCVPQWYRGLSRRSKMSKSSTQGGLTLQGESNFWDKLVSA